MHDPTTATAQQLRGGWYTPADLAHWICAWATDGAAHVLEPSCGDGAFLQAIAATAPTAQVLAVERDPQEAQRASERLRGLPNPGEVHCEDFFAWSNDRASRGPSVDAVVGNPPFIRYQLLDSTTQDRMEQLVRSEGQAFTRHTNAWVPFVLGALRHLEPGGRLGMVLPAELLHVLHAGAARQGLVQHCSQLLVVDPQELWFDGTLQGVVVLLAVKKRHPDEAGSLAIARCLGRDVLERPAQELWDTTPRMGTEGLVGKWMPALLKPSVRELLARVRAHPNAASMGELARSQVGIVTGANRFFVVPPSVVEAHDLGSYVQPIFGRSQLVPGVVYDHETHQNNVAHDRDVCFLDFGDRPLHALTEGAQRWIAQGEEQGLHRRYKCRIRTPWYAVPSVWAAPMAMLKRSHDLPRLVLNSAGTLTTDTAYRIRPYAGRAEDLVHAFINSVTALSAELEGRHYGGGVLELVPSEIARLLVPKLRAPSGGMETLDEAFRLGTPPQEVLKAADRRVLHALGLDREEQAALRAAWGQLKQRRQRRS